MPPARITWVQRFYAYRGPFWLWMTLMAILGLLLVSLFIPAPPDLFDSSPEARDYFILLLLMGLIGLAGCALVGPFILGPLYYSRARLNGAPFAVGDTVQILRGRQRGRKFRVVEVRDWRNTLRVDLGGKPRETWRDYFSQEYYGYLDVLKVSEEAAPKSTDE